MADQIIPVAILAIAATWALSSRGLEALVHSQIEAPDTTYQNTSFFAP
jgi:hypothetical protein